MARISKQRKKLLVQFVEYMISGGAYFWSGYAMFAFLYGSDFKLGGVQYDWPSLHWNLWWSTIISSLFGWTVNFILQRYWVFSNKALKGHATQVTGRYLFITLVDFVLNYFILFGLKQIGITPYIGQFISSGFFTVWNWFWYKYWVFPETFTKRKSKITTPRIVAHRAHGHSAYHLH